MVEVVEVSPRDGLQNERTILSCDDKLRLIERAVGAGARRIEATSFVSPLRVPQMADAEELMARVPREPGVSYIGLALNRRGVERALEADCDEVNLVVPVSDTFCRRNQGTGTDEATDRLDELCALVRGAGRRPSVTLAAAFGCPFEGEVLVERVVTVAERGVAAGAAELCLADTIGVAVPDDLRARVAAVRAVAGTVPLRVHLHDTRHTGVANAVAAIEAGVMVLDASLGGAGGCPFAPAATGNVATEDLLYLLERSGTRSGWNLGRACEAARWLEGVLSRPLPGGVSHAGPFPATVEGASWC